MLLLILVLFATIFRSGTCLSTNSTTTESTTAIPKYIVVPYKLTDSMKSIVMRRKLGTTSIGTSTFYFLTNLTEKEMEELGGAVVENTQVKINWHQQRIIQRTRSNYSTNFPYLEAAGINLYILDTGIDFSHDDFRTNQRFWGGNFVGDEKDADCNGHGTHVASLASGEQFGIARRTNLFALKVLGCDGTGYVSSVISAIGWAVQHHQAAGTKANSIINMSLGGNNNQALNMAVKLASAVRGIYCVTSAGNDNMDACNSSPGAEFQVLTVAATDSTDKRAEWSNYGPCVGVYAPGVDLDGAWPKNQVATLSGTSMASAVATGVFAVYLSRWGSSVTLGNFGPFTTNIIKENRPGTVNRFLFLNPSI